MKKIAVLVRSLRKDSFNRKIANALIALAPESQAFEILEIDGLSMYNQDLDATPPADWTEFRKRCGCSCYGRIGTEVTLALPPESRRKALPHAGIHGRTR